MYCCILSFESVACHQELAISKMFRITKHVQLSVVEYFSFFQQNSLEVFQDLPFLPDYEYNASSNSLRFFDFS